MLKGLLQKTGFFRISLGWQVALGILLVLLLSMLLTANLLRNKLQDDLVQESDEQSRRMLATLSSSLLDDLIIEDIPRLDTIISQITRYNDSVIYVRIENEEGNRLLEWGRGFSGVSNLFEYEQEVELEGEVFGRITIQVDQSQRYSDIDDHVQGMVLFMIFSLLIMSLLILLLIHRLVILPLRKIDQQIEKLTAGQLDIQPTGFFSADMNKLDASVIEHALILRKQDEYRRQLSTEKIRAEKASRAKSDFLSSMSHELRTPLNAILGFSQILRHSGELEKDNLESVREIEHAGQHLLSLVNQVLDLARIESGRLDLVMKPLDLSGLLRESARLVAPTAEQHRISLVTRIHPDISVRADALRLKQIVLNLLSNAIKYNRPHGRVEIRTGFEDSYIRVDVMDQGEGLNPEEQRQIFEPFNRLAVKDYQTEGAGIGLSISQSLVEKMQGRILVDSRKGQGSTFSILLPATS